MISHIVFAVPLLRELYDIHQAEYLHDSHSTRRHCAIYRRKRQRAGTIAAADENTSEISPLIRRENGGDAVTIFFLLFIHFA